MVTGRAEPNPGFQKIPGSGFFGIFYFNPGISRDFRKNFQNLIFMVIFCLFQLFQTIFVILSCILRKNARKSSVLFPTEANLVKK